MILFPHLRDQALFLHIGEKNCMRKFAAILIFFSVSASAQRLHIGIAGGLANYNGDLINKFYVAKQTNGFIGVTVHYEIYDQLLLRGSFSYARVNGNDSYNTKQVLQMRNLRFESVVAELSAVGELYLYNLYEKRFSPYLFAGLAVFYFNPYSHDVNLNKVFLKPLSTEGQGIYPDKKPYSLVQPAIPLGAGLKFAINDNIRIGVELGYRKLFTDYLDDVSKSYPDFNDLLTTKGQLAVDMSYRTDEYPGGNPLFPTKETQRGGSRYKDGYYFTGLNISYRLGGGPGGGGGIGGRRMSGKKNKMGCPAVPL
jgi:hypothetical protein